MNQPTGPLDIVFGEDGYRVNAMVAEIVASSDAALGDLNRTTFEGNKLSAAELRAALDTPPFLADRRVVVVRDLLTRFSGDPLSKAKLAELTAIVEALSVRPLHAHVVLMDGAVSATKNALLDGLTKIGARVHMLGLLSVPELRRWIQERARARDTRLSSGAIDALTVLIGPNLWTMASEIDKLALFAAGRAVTEADVLTLVASAREASAFALVDAVIAGRGTAELGRLSDILDQGESPYMILAMLQTRLRQLWLLRERLAMGEPLTMAKNRSGLGRIGDRALNAMLAESRRWDSERFRSAHRALLETDQAIKTGKADPRLALELLMMSFAERPATATRD